MHNSFVKKYIYVLCLTSIIILLHRIILHEDSIFFVIHLQKQSRNIMNMERNTEGENNKRNAIIMLKSSSKSDQAVHSKDANSYSFITMCDKHKRKIFEQILSKNFDPTNKEISESDKQKDLDLILLGQQNREILETVYGQIARNLTQKSDIIIIGTLNTSRPYAVFSTTIQNRESLSFLFLLPLTVLSWKRIGFESVVTVSGWRESWNSDQLYADVFQVCLRLGAVLIFFEPKPDNTVMISQVPRLLTANILKKEFQNHPGINDVYMLTTDADIWPLNGSVYHLPENYDILSLNSFCCAPFTHRNQSYRMLPMTNIGAKVSTWGKLMESNGTQPETIEDLLSMFLLEFGSVAQKPVKKEENLGWYLDHYMISIQVAKYLKNNTTQQNGKVKLVARSTGMDRVDRSNWSLNMGINEKVDSHLLLNAFIPDVWVKVIELLRLMYGEESAEFDFCTNYYKQFHERFLVKYKA